MEAELITKEHRYKLNLIRRSIAFIIDHLLALVAILLILLPFKNYLIENLFVGYNLLFTIILLILLFQTIFCIFEISFKGQSIGKKISGLKVIYYTEKNGSFKNIILRNFSRSTYFLPPLFILPDLLTYLFSKDHRRIGDFIAESNVVRETFDYTVL